MEVLDTSRRFLGASISEKNDKADNVGDTETSSRGLGQAEIRAFYVAQFECSWRASIQTNSEFGFAGGVQGILLVMVISVDL